MSNHAYIGSNDTSDLPYDFSTGRNLDLHDIHAIEHELMVQQRIQSQYFSPVQSQRRDSFSSRSLSNASNPDGHQAEHQPCLPAAQTISQERPVNMARSASRQSTSSDQQQRHDQHRASFVHGVTLDTLNMSRSPTQHSNMSAGFTERPTALQLGFTGYTASSSEHIAPAMLTTDMQHNMMSDTVNTAYSAYSGTQAARLAEVNGIGESVCYASSKSRMFDHDHSYHE
jgi:hypothetical protein